MGDKGDLIADLALTQTIKHRIVAATDAVKAIATVQIFPQPSVLPPKLP